MSEVESEFLKSLKRWLIGVVATLTTLFITGTIFVYKSTIETNVKVVYIQEDINDLKHEITGMKKQFYLIEK